MAWLYLTDRKGAAVQMQVSVDAFLQQWPKSMRDDLLYAYHLAWSGKHREMES